MSEEQPGNGIFSEEFRPTWYLLAIPGITVGLTILVSLFMYVSNRMKKKVSHEPMETRKSLPHIHLAVEETIEHDEQLPPMTTEETMDYLNAEFAASRPSVSFLEARRSSAVIIE